MTNKCTHARARRSACVRAASSRRYMSLDEASGNCEALPITVSDSLKVDKYGYWSSATQYWPPSGLLNVDFKAFKAGENQVGPARGAPSCVSSARPAPIGRRDGDASMRVVSSRRAFPSSLISPRLVFSLTPAPGLAAAPRLLALGLGRARLR